MATATSRLYRTQSTEVVQVSSAAQQDTTLLIDQRKALLRLRLLPWAAPGAALLSILEAGSPKTLQKRRVSSAPAVTTEAPSGDCAM
jgi:hypothetical protein